MSSKNNLNRLGERAGLSVAGKAVIGVVGGVILLLLGIVSNCNDNSHYAPPDDIKWLEFEVVNPITLLDSSKKVEHLIRLGIKPNVIDSVRKFMYYRLNGGKLISTISQKEADSLCSFNTNIIDSSIKYYYIESLDSSDFIIAIKDSLIWGLFSPVLSK